MINPQIALSGQMAATITHRIYQLSAKSWSLRLSGAIADGEACHAHAVALADMLLDPASTDDRANLMLTSLIC